MEAARCEWGEPGVHARRAAEKCSFAPSLQQGKNIQNRIKPPNPLSVYPTDWTDKIFPRYIAPGMCKSLLLSERSNSWKTAWSHR